MSIRTLPNISLALNCALLALMSVALMLCHSRFNIQINQSNSHHFGFVEAYKDNVASNNHQYNSILFESTRFGSREPGLLAETTRLPSSAATTATTEAAIPTTTTLKSPLEQQQQQLERKSSIANHIPLGDDEIFTTRNHQNSKQQLDLQLQQTALVRIKPGYIDDNNDRLEGYNLASSSSNKSTIKPKSSQQFNTNNNNTTTNIAIRSRSPKQFDEIVEVSESQPHINHNSQCALILKRTYILKNNPANNDEWGDKFVFNDIDNDSSKKKVHKSDLCIKHSDVDKAIEEAKHKIKFEKPDDLDSLEVSEKSIAAIAELNLATGQVLTKKFDLSHDEILNALPMIDMSSSKFYWKDLCPKHIRSMTCTKSRYRTITAHCNNLKHSSWGAAKTPYSRYLPPDYADGLTLPRASKSGEPLPSARLITSIVHRDADEPSNDYSAAFASWGQLLNHDVTRHAVGEGKCLLVNFDD